MLQIYIKTYKYYKQKIFIQIQKHQENPTSEYGSLLTHRRNREIYLSFKWIEKIEINIYYLWSTIQKRYGQKLGNSDLCIAEYFI